MSVVGFEPTFALWKSSSLPLTYTPFILSYLYIYITTAGIEPAYILWSSSIIPLDHMVCLYICCIEDSNPTSSDYKTDAVPSQLIQLIFVLPKIGIEPILNAYEAYVLTIELPKYLFYHFL